MKVEQIDHLGIYVKDLDKGARFFRDVFGFEFSREFGAQGMDVREVVDTRGLDLLAAKSTDGPMARIIEPIPHRPALWRLRRMVVMPNPMSPRGAGLARLSSMTRTPFEVWCGEC